MKGPLLILFLSCALIAETAAPIGQSAPQAAAPVSRGANPNAIPTFDEGFFNKVGPGSEKPGSFDGSDSKVTSDVRARLLSECESKKASGMAAYGKCYREKENAVVNSREKEIDRINTQNNLPLRNTPKLIEEVQSKSVEDND